MLMLRGACRSCHKPISWRYPLVEFLTGASTVLLVQRFGCHAVTLVYLAFLYGLIAASFIDLEFQIIPDEISVGGLVIGLALSVLLPTLHGTDSRLIALARSVIGLLVGGGLLYGTGLLGDFLFKKESMGGGDIKLLAMAGSILGWKLVTMTFFIAPVFALIPGLAVLVLKRSHVIPYGPFLAIGLLVSLFSGHEILRMSGIEETIRLLGEYYFRR
jgi:leader peptidase (prepilin peptidase)/N-methyltransferase